MDPKETPLDEFDNWRRAVRFLAIARILKDQKGMSKEYFNFLKKYLATFKGAGDDADAIGDAKEEASTAIIEFVKSSDLYQLAERQSLPNFWEMERGQNGRDDFFGARDPFAGFGGFGRQRSLISGFFGGRDPFDDPFFTQPFGSRMGGPSMFGPSLFGPMGGPFGDMRNDGFLEQAPPTSNSRKPIITELDDAEGENAERNNNQSNHESYVQEPDDGNDEMQGGQIQQRRDFNRANGGQPQARTFTYQSSSVTYGGINGAYYTASKTRRTGSDGITVEESKEADTTTKEATHRISRGIHDKGHSLARKLNSDGKVDTTQILHNLNEDELAGFEESWKGNAGHHLPGQNAGTSNNDNFGNREGNGRGRQSAWSGALPGTEQARDPRHRNRRPKSRVIQIT